MVDPARKRAMTVRSAARNCGPRFSREAWRWNRRKASTITPEKCSWKRGSPLAGDEAVTNALNQLIEDHHAQAQHFQGGQAQPSPSSTPGSQFGEVGPNHVVVEPQPAGDPASMPYLISDPCSGTIRLYPAEDLTLTVSCVPPEPVGIPLT